MFYYQHDPESEMPCDQALFSNSFDVVIRLFPAEPRGGLRLKSQMERTRAHNKDKWLEHEI